MTLSELTPEQITAIFVGVAGLIAAIGALAHRAANRAPSEQATSTHGVGLFMDPAQIKQVQNLSDQIGLLTTALVRNGASLDRNSDVCDRMLRVLEQTQDDLRDMTREIVRGARER